MKVLWSISVRFFAFVLAASYFLAPAGLVFAATPKPTCSITINKSSINLGDSITVKWTSTNATAGAITNIGNVAPSGSINLLPTAAGATYYGAFTGAGGTGNCQAKVVVNSSGTGSLLPPTTTGNPVDVGTAIQTQTTPQSNGSSGLVPCGYGTFSPDNNTKSNSTACQACDLATLFQNIITFAIGLSIPIAAALFAWAGVLMFTAADDSGKITQAKQIFKNAFIGFVIAITAWIIINTVLAVIFSSNSGYVGGSWFKISCATERKVTGSINDVLGRLNSVSTNGTPSYDNNGSGISDSGNSGGNDSVYSCAGGSKLSYVDQEGGYNICTASDGTESAVQCNGAAGYHLANTSDINSGSYSGECANQNNQVVDYSPATTGSIGGSVKGNSGAGTTQWLSQLQQACQNANLSDCTIAQAIMANESSGRQGIISPVGAAGLMQVMPDTARGLDPANLSGLSNAQITQKLTSDPAYNMQLGTQYIAQLSNQFNGDPALIAAAYNGGAKANRTSNTCAGETQWQCTANPGYAETRVYVPKVLSTYNSLK